MSVEVKIPTVGESITSGVIATWHKKDGETVKAGDALLTLETDKVSTEIPAEHGGVLHIRAAEGTEVKIGEVVATIDEGGSAAPAGDVAKAKDVLPPKPTGRIQTPAEPEPAKTKGATEFAAETTAPKESFAARAAEPQTEEEPRASASAAAASEGRFVRKKMSPLRRKIAAQLVMAQQNAAILTTFNECDMTAVVGFRKQMQDTFQKEHGIKLGFMSFFVKATVAALKSCPAINGRIDGDDFIQNHYYDIGVAVGTERGLVVPVIRDADQKSFAEIEKDLADYATKAREGKIKIEDLSGGVFTISNGGVYGSLLSTPILNPPQSGILGMHKTQDRPVAIKGQVVIRPMMYLALSYDHRAVDGKEAVTFLVRVKECIEEPMRLLL